VSQGACTDCLARAWLRSRLAAHLEPVRARLDEILALDDDDLLAAVAGKQRVAIRRELLHFDARETQRHCREVGVETICRCHPDYPSRLRELAAPPSVLHVAGGLDRFLELVGGDPVAIVGARRASEYGLGVAGWLGRGLSAASVTVISGMALGVDSAAGTAALEAGANTVAVLPGPSDRPYPPSKRRLYRRICQSGAVVSELPPGARLRRWMFPARNRLIAALSALTVVVEAAEGSGALLTAGMAARLGREVGAVPGRVTSPLAAGTNRLLAEGARVIRDCQDALDAVFGAGVRCAPADTRPQLENDERSLLQAIANGEDTSTALARAGLSAGEGLAALARLELGGYLLRQPGGRFAVMP
jgi:DNA processing protein